MTASRSRSSSPCATTFSGRFGNSRGHACPTTNRALSSRSAATMQNWRSNTLLRVPRVESVRKLLAPRTNVRVASCQPIELAQGTVAFRRGECAPLAMTTGLAWMERMANMGRRLFRSHKYRLYPNRAQEAALTDMLGHFCDLCNAGLQQRIEAWSRQGVSLGYVQQAGELKAVRDAVPELAGYSYSAEQQVLRRLDKAFAAFFRRVKAGKTPGFPRFRAKSRFHSADSAARPPFRPGAKQWTWPLAATSCSLPAKATAPSMCSILRSGKPAESSWPAWDVSRSDSSEFGSSASGHVRDHAIEIKCPNSEHAAPVRSSGLVQPGLRNDACVSRWRHLRSASLVPLSSRRTRPDAGNQGVVHRRSKSRLGYGGGVSRAGTAVNAPVHNCSSQVTF